MQKIALVFPGQGSQTVGMLSELASAYAIISDTFAEASHALGYDLWQLVQNGPEEQLNQTEFAQPALLTAGVALWRVWRKQANCPAPAFLAGHSLGEYTALTCAGVFTFADAVKLVALRGRIMQEAVPLGVGAMAAIVGLSDAQVMQICCDAQQGEVLTPANYNSPGQIVIAGNAQAVERALQLAVAQKAKMAKKLIVSIPSHCELLRGAADKLRAALDALTLRAPQIPVVHNVDVAFYTDVGRIKDALTQQLYSPVRWVETIQMMHQNGIEAILECGPGKVLTGLNKRIASDIIFDMLGTLTGFQSAVSKICGDN